MTQHTQDTAQHCQISTCPVHCCVCSKQEKCITDYKISTCPASKNTCQGNRTSGNQGDTTRGNQGNRTSGNQGNRTSGNQGNRTSGMFVL